MTDPASLPLMPDEALIVVSRIKIIKPHDASSEEIDAAIKLLEALYQVRYLEETADCGGT